MTFEKLKVVVLYWKRESTFFSAVKCTFALMKYLESDRKYWLIMISKKCIICKIKQTWPVCASEWVHRNLNISLRKVCVTPNNLNIVYVNIHRDSRYVHVFMYYVYICIFIHIYKYNPFIVQGMRNDWVQNYGCGFCVIISNMYDHI